MKLIEIDNQERLNNFIVRESPGNFLQSFEWGEFQKFLGRKIWRLGIEEDGKLVCAVLVVRNHLPFKKCYLYSPRGPIIERRFKIENQEFKKILLSKIQEIAREEKAIFWRFDFVDSDLPLFLKKKATKSLGNVQPKKTLILDLDQSEEEVLAKMKSKTRYNIRLAQKKGVSIRQSVGQKDFGFFLSLTNETAKRDGFKAHSELYYQKMFDFFVKLGILKIFLAEFNGKIIAANLVLFWGGWVTYLHGASSSLQRNLMAPYLLQWEQILTAKRQGYSQYDFWGIMAQGNSYKSWAGITRFKTGFGGREVGYAGTYEIILNNFWYKIYRFTKG